MAAVHNLTGRVKDNGGALLVFVGPPNRSIEWRLVEGNGTLTPFTSHTDTLGRATARFDADGFSGPVVVGVAYVP